MVAGNPPDPTCPLCSKPIRSGAVVVYEHGEFLHVWCRAVLTQRTCMEEVDRAKSAYDRAVGVVEQAERAPKFSCESPRVTREFFWRG